jgi:hypothetical protein
VTNTTSLDTPLNSISTNSNYNNAPTYDPSMSNAANLASIYTLTSNNSPASSLGLGVVQQTIGSPRLIQMSLRLVY